MDRKISIGAISIPAVGLGTYLCSDEEARVSVAHALKCGYRHIDTAEFYANHKGIAAGIKEAGISREEIFITDKVNPGGLFGQPGRTFEEIQSNMKNMLAQLACEYVDLYLIHHAAAKEQRLDQWRALVDLQKQGLAKHIGVSNFSISHLEEIKVCKQRVKSLTHHSICQTATLFPA
jgi:2,5-diketo-D-gluconate reductase A